MTTNPFIDQETFMRACGQTSIDFNQEQFFMYLKLINEETKELTDALANNDKVEMLDALIDMIVVIIGAMHSAGFDAEGAWNEVMRTNFAKIDPATGTVNKREDGKVLKPEGWQPPNLTPFLVKR
jgi:predicted HAD superfamily Cof-like phosphohydrolase